MMMRVSSVAKAQMRAGKDISGQINIKPANRTKAKVEFRETIRNNVRPVIKVAFAHWHRELTQYWPTFIRILESRIRVQVVETSPGLVLGCHYYRSRDWLEPTRHQQSITQSQAGRIALWTEESQAILRRKGTPILWYDTLIGNNSACDHLVPSWAILCIDWWKDPLKFTGLLDTPELLCRRDQYSFPKTRQNVYIASVHWNGRQRAVENSGLKLDCPGRIMNNCTDPDLTPRKSTERWEGKLRVIGKYRRTIALENQREPHYITEKLLHPLMVRSVPIVWDRGNIGVVNPDAVAEIGNPTELVSDSCPVFESPAKIREMYGPRALAEMILG